MIKMEIDRCPGTLAAGFTTYSRTCSKRVFNGSKVNHILPYASLQSNHNSDDSFEENAIRMSISGVQEKFSIIQLKNKIRLTKEGEQGTHILKPIPSLSKNADQMPANEHVTMQIAKQIFGIETAENALWSSRIPRTTATVTTPAKIALSKASANQINAISESETTIEGNNLRPARLLIASLIECKSDIFKLTNS